MGASASTAAAAADAALSSPRVLALLARLAGAAAIPLADVFWTDLLELRAVDEEDDDDDGTPRVALASVDPAALEETLGSRVADALVRNSARSGNLASLLVHAAKRLREVDVEETEEKGDRRRDRESSRATSDDRVVAATNGVVLVALVAKRLVEGRADDRGDGEGVGECVGHDIGRRRRERRPAWKAFCDARPREGGADAAPALETFLLAVVDAAREVARRRGGGVDDSTYALHHQIARTLLVFASTQARPRDGGAGGGHDASAFYSDSESEFENVNVNHIGGGASSSDDPFLDALTRACDARDVATPDGYAAGDVMRALLGEYFAPRHAPKRVGRASLGKDIVGRATWLSPLSDTAAYAAAALTHHATCPDGRDGAQRRPFGDALGRFADEDAYVADAGPRAQPAVSYASVLEACCAHLDGGSPSPAVLLLYALLHGNDAFRAYVLGDAARLSKVLTPTLRGLYDASKRESYKEKTVSDGDGVGAAGKKSSHDVTYVLLVIVLILTQDDAFGDALSNALIPVGPNWYEERMLRRTPLGSLLVLVLVRTVHRHLAGSEPLRDVYLHTNCLAAMANVAPRLRGLTAFASRRLVTLFETLSRKRARALARELENSSDLVSGNASNAAFSDAEDDEIELYADFMRIVLEIINSVLTYALPDNPELVYALLHRAELFDAHTEHPRFADLVGNVRGVLNHFSDGIHRGVGGECAKGEGEGEGAAAGQNANAAARGEGMPMTTKEVMCVVNTLAKKFRADSHVHVFQELRFAYEEEADPAAFFSPFLWRLVVEDVGRARSATRWGESFTKMVVDGAS